MIPHLIPRPHEVRIDDPCHWISTDGLLDELSIGIGHDSHQWSALADERPEELGREGYVLRVQDAAPRALVAALDQAGGYRAQQRVRELVDSAARMHALTIRDAPFLERRGVVEGFYGEPWSHRDRLDFFRFAGRVAFNEYMYAPKDDPYHRERWRDPYPPEDLARIAELAGTASDHQVDFVYAISPALDMRFTDDRDHDALAEKAEQLWSAGVRSFALLFDDVASDLPDPADRATFGMGPDGAGRAHGVACSRFSDSLFDRHGARDPITMCPTDYAGSAPSAYRSGLQQTLPADAIVMWTGADVVVGDVTRADIDAAAASFGRRLMLWDNFPVNDFDRSRLFLGPLLGRTTDLVGSALVGIASNPMVESLPSRFALASAADWGWNPSAYTPDDAAERAIDVVAGREAEAIRPLVAVCSSWPPSASQSAEIESLEAAALAGDGVAAQRLAAVFELLSRAGGEGKSADSVQDPLLSALEPWVAAARDAGAAGLAACSLLRTIEAADTASVAVRVAEVTAAREKADAHYPNVLRPLLPHFVRTVLDRAGVPDLPLDTQLRIAMITGIDPIPGDRDLAERLSARGHRVEIEREGEPVSAVDLVIVTPSASADVARAVAASDVPLLAWGRLEILGLATSSGVLIDENEIYIASAGNPLAAGLDGSVAVYRGSGSVTWCENSGLGEVIARDRREERPVIVRYPAGTPLPGGGDAPAARVAFFLGADGLAPWLMTDAGHALFTAAVDTLVGLSPRMP